MFLTFNESQILFRSNILKNVFLSKKNTMTMKNLICLFLLTFLCFSANAQLELPPSGANQKAKVVQYMGAHAYVAIIYNSPDVTSPQGQDRKGNIWGNLVPYGLTNLNFGISTADNPSPWRAGANENSIIKFSHDVKVQGKELKAGSYGVHLIPNENEDWVLILSNNDDAWGSYFYKESDDALRVNVKPQDSDYNEWLTYEIDDRQENSCRVSLKWENLSIPFSVELQDPVAIYLAHLREQMQDAPGFNWVNRNAAANYCLQNEVNLEEAYEWQKITSGNSFLGSENITTLSTKAGLELKLDMREEALTTFEKAARHPTANVFNIHALGRQLITIGEKETALKFFELNLEKNGNAWPTNVGMARGLSAVGDYTKALKYAELAYEQAPDKLNKDGLANSIEKLKNNEDIN